MMTFLTVYRGKNLHLDIHFVKRNGVHHVGFVSWDVEAEEIQLSAVDSQQRRVEREALYGYRRIVDRYR